MALVPRRFRFALLGLLILAVAVVCAVLFVAPSPKRAQLVLEAVPPPVSGPYGVDDEAAGGDSAVEFVLIRAATGPKRLVSAAVFPSPRGILRGTAAARSVVITLPEAADERPPPAISVWAVTLETSATGGPPTRKLAILHRPTRAWSIPLLPRLRGVAALIVAVHDDELPEGAVASVEWR